MTYPLPSQFGTPPDQQTLGALGIPVYASAGALQSETGTFQNGVMVAVQSPTPQFYMAQLSAPISGAYLTSQFEVPYGNGFQIVYWVPFAGSSNISVPFNLAAIQAMTSGTPVAVGSSLGPYALLLGASIVVATPVTGGTLTSVVATVQGGSDGPGTIIGATNVFAAAGTFSTPGTDVQGSPAYSNRGGQQIYLTLTSVGDTLADATAGSLFVNLIVGNAAEA